MEFHQYAEERNPKQKQKTGPFIPLFRGWDERPTIVKLANFALLPSPLQISAYIYPHFTRETHVRPNTIFKSNSNCICYSSNDQKRKFDTGTSRKQKNALSARDVRAIEHFLVIDNIALCFQLIHTVFIATLCDHDAFCNQFIQIIPCAGRL